MRIVHIASEGYPFSKTGGLADVVGALPLAQAALGAEVHVIQPYYDRLLREPIAALPPIESRGVRVMIELGELGTWPAEVYGARLERAGGAAVQVHLLRCPAMFDRAGLYQDHGLDFADNCARFAFFSKAALAVIGALDLRPDVLHGHDWQTGLVFALLATRYPLVALPDGVATVFTIHNLAYQGSFPAWLWNLLSLPQSVFTSDGLEFYGRINLLKAGLLYANALVAASPTYAREITGVEHGQGLDGVLRSRGQALRGILNGIDTDEWDPARDQHLVATYSAQDLSGKARCKAELQAAGKLAVDARAPLLGFVGRLAGQKGVDLLLEAVPSWLAAGGQLVVLGSGEPGLEAALAALAAQHPGRVAVTTAFDEPRAHRIEAGADFFVMPSRYEPCGLNQLISLRYGTVPIVRATGGLADTVSDLATEGGTGIVFEPFATDDLVLALERAFELYRRPQDYAAVQRRGMLSDVSWGPRALQYHELYRELIARYQSEPEPEEVEEAAGTGRRRAP